MRGIYYKTERRIFYCKSKKFFTHTHFLSSSPPFLFSWAQFAMLGKPGSEIRQKRYERAIRWFEGVAKGPNINPCIRQNLTFADSVALFLRASSLFSTACKRTFWWKTVWKSCILYGVLKKQLNLNYRTIQYDSITNLFEDSNCCFGTHLDTAIYVN